jgi:hypothetical protein
MDLSGTSYKPTSTAERAGGFIITVRPPAEMLLETSNVVFPEYPVPLSLCPTLSTLREDGCWTDGWTYVISAVESRLLRVFQGACSCLLGAREDNEYIWRR